MMHPHPWYLSASVAWEDGGSGWSELRRSIAPLMELLPLNLIPVPDPAMHCTILPICRIDLSANESSDTKTEGVLSGFAADTFEPIPDTCSISPISLQPIEIRCFTTSLSVQFEDAGGSLAEFRDWLKQQIGAVSPPGGFDYVDLIQEDERAEGNFAYGHFARSVSPFPSSLQWREPCEPQGALMFDAVRLVLSDPWLTNRSAHDGYRQVNLVD